jgi:antitoxin PrlF
MPLAHSKVTAQGQISVPAEVRKKLGIGPGSILEWEERNDQIVVRKAGRNTSAHVHEALFDKTLPEQPSSTNVKESIKKYIREKHARR